MPERSHTPMGHAHCTSGAPTCSEIPHSLAWSRKAPSIHDVPRGGTVRVLTNRDVKPSGRVLRLCPAFCLREARWWLQLEVRKTSSLHYTTALHTISPVFSHHTNTISPVFSHHTNCKRYRLLNHTLSVFFYTSLLYVSICIYIYIYIYACIFMYMSVLMCIYIYICRHIDV